VAAGLVRGIGAVAADESQGERIAHVQAAHAVGRAQHGNSEKMHELGELRARLGQVTPWPMNMTGLLAASSMSTVVPMSSGEAPLRR